MSDGLAGVVAGLTAICTVGKEGTGLTYRGYDIHDLAKHASFEDVAYLLHFGQLPAEGELTAIRNVWKGYRGLPDALRRSPTGRPQGSFVVSITDAYRRPMTHCRGVVRS